MKQVVLEHTQTSMALPAKVFLLLCPVREAEWIPGWKYRLVSSQSGVAELGCVFTTPNEHGSETTWIVTHHNPDAYQIAFAWVWPEIIATRLEIRLVAKEENTTRSDIRYIYTALTAAGELELAKYDVAWFEKKMKSWEAAINYFLCYGRCIHES